MHKPWILTDPFHPNMATRIDGRYYLFTVSFKGIHKIIQMATSATLDGPWHVRAEPVIDLGPPDTFEGYHIDTPTAWWFADRGEILVFYMGYPSAAQADQPHSPFGSVDAVAVMKPDDPVARKLGPVLRPSALPGHWTTGWAGGLQIIPAHDGGWFAVINASPTPPAPVAENPYMREPAPSLGGWAYTAESWPVKGWQVADEPIERIEDVPDAARQAGEGTNFWRQHLLVLPDGRMLLYYNSGPYGSEQMFAKQADTSTSLQVCG